MCASELFEAAVPAVPDDRNLLGARYSRHRARRLVVVIPSQ